MRASLSKSSLPSTWSFSTITTILKRSDNPMELTTERCVWFQSVPRWRRGFSAKEWSTSCWGAWQFPTHSMSPILVDQLWLIFHTSSTARPQILMRSTLLTSYTLASPKTSIGYLILVEDWCWSCSTLRAMACYWCRSIPSFGIEPSLHECVIVCLHHVGLCLGCLRALPWTHCVPSAYSWHSFPHCFSPCAYGDDATFRWTLWRSSIG